MKHKIKLLNLHSPEGPALVLGLVIVKGKKRRIELWQQGEKPSKKPTNPKTVYTNLLTPPLRGDRCRSFPMTIAIRQKRWSNKDLRIQFDPNRYCVPHRYLGRRLTVKADSSSVAIYHRVEE